MPRIGFFVSCYYSDFFTLAPPVRSIIFPYTTLFRSPFAWMDRALSKYRGVERPGAWAEDALALGPFDTAILDRKSTRLNSSHITMSYAVVCLKKKRDYLSPAT